MSNMMTCLWWLLVTLIVGGGLAGQGAAAENGNTTEPEVVPIQEGALQELKIFANPAEAETQCDDVATDAAGSGDDEVCYWAIRFRDLELYTFSIGAAAGVGDDGLFSLRFLERAEKCSRYSFR
ncbi:Collagenase NC10 and Endostatin family protein [Trichuris trichiura]|uniref:Collagenase NC10 and Endostatin family protein n=1 Tax=Trichuris trichiura TaxID=36087 RepID=A0A077Z5W0_TRITR|nr:Collagenase NC10 and Endostatin family protein [Trichuris trichiura]